MIARSGGLRRPGYIEDQCILVIGLVVAAGAGMVVAFAGTDAERPTLITALAVLVPGPLVVRGLQGRFDAFEPINFFVLGIFVLFVLRPIFELHYHSTQFGSYSDLAGFDGALLTALVGTAGLYAGYALKLGARLASRIPSIASDWSAAVLGRMTFVLLAVGALLFLVFAIETLHGLGGVIEFFKGRQANSGGTNSQQSSAYLYYGPYVSIPATLLFLLCWQRDRRRSWLLSAAFAGGLSLLITVPRGDRTFVLTLLVPLFVLPYLLARRRPKLISVVLVLILVIPILNVLIVVRNVSARSDVTQKISSAFKFPAKDFKVFMLGPDTAMFSVLALTHEVVPSRLAYKPGRVILATLAAPVPGLLWHSKPLDGLSVVYDYLFYRQAAVTRAGNSSGFFGSSYYDSGLPGVMLYSLVVGIVFRALWEWWRTHRDSDGVLVFFAAVLPLTIVLQRGAIYDTLARSAFLIGPLILLPWLASRRSGAPHTA